MTTQKEAMEHCKALEKIWHEDGYTTAKFWPEMKRLPRSEIVWTTKSNLVNGLPPKPKKGRVVEVFEEQKVNYFDRLLDEICEEFLVSERCLKAYRVSKDTVPAFKQFCIRAFESGKTVSSIASYFGKDHSSISYHIRGK